MQARKLARAALFSSISALVALISFFVVCTWGSIVRRNSICLCTSSRRALAAGAPMLFLAAVATILGQAWQNFPSSHKLSLTHLSLCFKLFQFKIKFAAFSHQPAGFVSFLWKFKWKKIFFERYSFTLWWSPVLGSSLTCCSNFGSESAKTLL